MTTWNMGSLMELATGYWKSATLSAAVQLDLFHFVAGGGATAGEIAAHTAADERAAIELLDALTAMGLLEKQDGRYRLEPGAAAFLDPASPSCLLDALRFNIDLYPLWGRLAESVRAGTPALPPRAHLGDDPARTRRFALGMHSRALGLAPALLPAVDVSGCATLLDVGAGPGTFSRLLAEREAALTVTQFDLPGVLAVARELGAASPAAARLRFAPGNYRTDALSGPFDAVLYCGALHQENPETAGALFAKIRGALRPGGRVIVVDLMLDRGRAGPQFANLFSLNMLLTSPFGRVFELEEAAALLREAGFAGVDGRQLGFIPYGVVTGRVP